jgi:hypothetical protein
MQGEGVVITNSDEFFKVVVKEVERVVPSATDIRLEEASPAQGGEWVGGISFTEKGESDVFNVSKFAVAAVDIQGKISRFKVIG